MRDLINEQLTRQKNFPYPYVRFIIVINYLFKSLITKIFP